MYSTIEELIHQENLERQEQIQQLNQPRFNLIQPNSNQFNLIHPNSNQFNLIHPNANQPQLHPNVNQPHLHPNLNQFNVNQPHLHPNLIQFNVNQPQLHPNSNQFIDIHTFDYTYADKQLEELKLNDEEKVEWIKKLMDCMKNPLAIEGSRLILSNIGMHANLDQTNQKRAEDLLVLLSKHVLEKDSSFLELLEEQLIDMVQLGQCAQGRTTRLWQLYVTIM